MINIQDFKHNKEILSKKTSDIHVDSVMIENGNIIEKLFYKNDELHEIRSCSKLLVAMAVGVAIDNKMLVVDTPLTLETKVWPVLKNLVDIINKENLQKIENWTIENLLTHTAGYEGQMMSERFIQDIDKDKLLDYALNYSIPYEVGTRFAYNNLEPFIISVFFQEAFNINLSDFINEQIFKKLEIVDYRWPNYGKYCPGSTGLLLRHFDFHKIGQLLLSNGKYNTIQVLPLIWVDAMCSMKIETPAGYKPERVLPKVGAGYFTFTSRDGFVFRDGADGQYIIVNRQQDLLITILSSEPIMKNVTEILRDLI